MHQVTIRMPLHMNHWKAVPSSVPSWNKIRPTKKRKKRRNGTNTKYHPKNVHVTCLLTNIEFILFSCRKIYLTSLWILLGEVSATPLKIPPPGNMFFFFNTGFLWGPMDRRFSSWCFNQWIEDKFNRKMVGGCIAVLIPLCWSLFGDWDPINTYGIWRVY